MIDEVFWSDIRWCTFCLIIDVYLFLGLIIDGVFGSDNRWYFFLSDNRWYFLTLIIDGVFGLIIDGACFSSQIIDVAF